jgi:hypothetical protein
MKKLILLAFAIVPMLFSNARAADETTPDVLPAGTVCAAIAQEYADQADKLQQLFEDMLTRVNAGEQYVELEAQLISRNLAQLLNVHRENNCDDIDFITVYAQSIFDNEEHVGDYVYAMSSHTDRKLSARYCASIRDAYTRMMTGSSVFGLTFIQIRKYILTDGEDGIEILFEEDETDLSKEYGDQLGVPLLFSDSGKVTPEMIDGMTDDELMAVATKATSLMDIYGFVEELQEVRFATFCPGEIDAQ